LNAVNTIYLCSFVLCSQRKQKYGIKSTYLFSKQENKTICPNQVTIAKSENTFEVFCESINNASKTDFRALKGKGGGYYFTKRTLLK
jgi:hypothetical protein